MVTNAIYKECLGLHVCVWYMFVYVCRYGVYLQVLLMYAQCVLNVCICDIYVYVRCIRRMRAYLCFTVCVRACVRACVCVCTCAVCLCLLVHCVYVVLCTCVLFIHLSVCATHRVWLPISHAHTHPNTQTHTHTR